MIDKGLVAGLATVVVVAVPAQAAPQPVSVTPEPTTAVVSEPPPAGEFTVDLVTVNGSGCPVGTVAVAVAPDNQAFRLAYSTYLVVRDPGETATVTRRNCQLALLLNYPVGYTYAVNRVVYQGYAQIAAGATGIVRAVHHPAGISGTLPSTLDLRGPFDDWWTLDDVPETGVLAWAPCGERRHHLLTNELRILEDTQGAEETSYLDLSEYVTVYLTWRRCEPQATTATPEPSPTS
jgi:hypothetical protein